MYRARSNALRSLRALQICSGVPPSDKSGRSVSVGQRLLKDETAPGAAFVRQPLTHAHAENLLGDLVGVADALAVGHQLLNVVVLLRREGVEDPRIAEAAQRHHELDQVVLAEAVVDR